MGLRNTSGNTERSTYREPCKDKVRSGLRAAGAQAAGSDPLRAGGIVCPSAGGRLGRPSGRCVRMETLNRSGARSACHASLHQHHRTPRPARASASVRRSGPLTGHHRAAGGDATTIDPPLPARRATRGVSSRCDHQSSRRSPQNLRRGETRNGDCSPLHSPERCVSPLRRRLAVVK